MTQKTSDFGDFGPDRKLPRLATHCKLRRPSLALRVRVSCLYTSVECNVLSKKRNFKVRDSG